MLRVLLEEHRQNFRKLLLSAAAIADAHAGGRVPNHSSANLLRFYAAEVGLKYLLNTVKRVPFMHELGTKGVSVESYSHRLPEMVEELKIPAGRVPAPPKQWHKCLGGYNDGSGGQRFEVPQAHEAWRYGLTINATDEAEITAYINGVTEYLEQEIVA